MADLTVNINGAPTPVYLGDSTALAAMAANRAAASEAVALAAAGPNYASTAAGLSATTVGQTFAVESAGIVTVYRHDAGPVATALRTLPTTAALAGSGGASMIGFMPDGVGAIPRQLDDKAREIVSVDDFGAVGDGVTDDYANIAAAQAALVARGGGELQFTPGKVYLIDTPIEMAPGVTYRGTGRSGINQVYASSGAKILVGASAAFVNGDGTFHEITFRDLFIHSQPGKGHIFDWSVGVGVIDKIEFDGCTFVQENPDKYIVKGAPVGGGNVGVFSIWMHHCDYQYATGNTVPPLYFACFTVNSIVIEKTWSTCTTEATSGVPSIHFESTNVGGPAINCIVRDVVFELPGGGSVKMLSCANSGVENCTVYDLTVTPNNPQFEIGQGVSGPVSNNCWLKGCRSQVGSAGVPDVLIDAGGAQGQFAIVTCSLAYLDGGGGVEPNIAVIGSDITNFQSIAYVGFARGPQNDLVFGTTAGGSSRNWTIANGFSGWNNGALNFLQNGSWNGGLLGSGLFAWAGTAANPSFYVDTSGEMRTKRPLYPPDGAGAFQSAASIIAGTGVPDAALGTDGQFYLRGDGAPGSAIYKKSGGAWSAIA